MSVHQVLKAASDTGITLRIDGPDLVVEADNDIPEALLGELRGRKSELIAALTEGDAVRARFSDLYETERDYARALLRYAEQDGLSLTTKDGRLVIAVSSKSDPNLLLEIRAHEGAVIQVLAAGLSQGFRPPIMKVAPFGCDAVPERFRAAWEAFTAQCPPGVMPLQWQFAVTDAADLFSYWGLRLIKLGFTPGDIFDVRRDGKPGGLAWAVQGSPVSLPSVFLLCRRACARYKLKRLRALFTWPQSADLIRRDLYITPRGFLGFGGVKISDASVPRPRLSYYNCIRWRF